MTTPRRAVSDVARRPRSWLPHAIVLVVLALVAHADTTRPLDALHPALVPATQDSSAVHGTGQHVEIVVEGHVTEADTEAVRWARERFREADLPLPARLRVTFHDDREPCEGAQGGFMIEEGVSRVLVCVPERGVRELKVKRTLLHEFAHAWDHAALTDRVRAAFMRFRGSDGWLKESDVPYEERAGEHAAETIMWGLMDEPFLVGSMSDRWPWEDLHDGYVILTGSEPPHGYVWSPFAVTPSHRTYAHTPSQLEIVERVWEQVEHREHDGQVQDVEVRFHRDAGPCAGAPIRSELVDGRLHVRACPASSDALTRELLQELRDSQLGAVEVGDPTPEDFGLQGL